MTWLFKQHCQENPHIVCDEFKQAIYQMYRDAVDLEDQIIDITYEMGSPQGLSSDEMKTYIRYVADVRLQGLGLKANWGIEQNPLPWLDWVTSNTEHSNFFEQRSASYMTGGLIGDDWGW